MALWEPKLQEGEWPPLRSGKRAEFLHDLRPPHQTDDRLALDWASPQWHLKYPLFRLYRRPGRVERYLWPRRDVHHVSTKLPLPTPERHRGLELHCLDVLC